MVGALFWAAPVATRTSPPFFREDPFTMLARDHFHAAARVLLGALFFSTACQPSAPPAARNEVALSEKPQKATPEDRPVAQPEPAPEPVPVPPPGERPTALGHPGLLDPSQAVFTAPERFTVVLDTTKGLIDIDVRRSWAPGGADRFYSLVKIGYFDGTAFFRVISGFMAQVGIHGDPAVNRAWRMQKIEDDPATQSNTRGMVSFATSGRNSRVNQFFINFGDNARLDPMGFAPIGRVRDMAVVDKLYAGYGEGAPAGQGPLQGRLQSEGNAYLKAEFPELDYIRRAHIGEEVTPPEHRKPR
jgi:peptidyl-prolyl cis-trans isomerase A (cyclophilin A)